MTGKVNRKALAYWLGVARSTLYYRPRMPEKDWQTKIQIETVLHDKPSYGSRRIAAGLGFEPR